MNTAVEESQKKEIGQLKRVIAGLKAELGSTQSFFEEIQNYVASIDPPDIKISEPQGVSATPVSAVLVLSDWHIGEHVDAADIEEFNQYNWEVAQERVRNLTDKFTHWIETVRHSWNISEIVVLCLGDMIAGDIHQELVTHADFPTPVQIVNAGYLVGSLVAAISPLVPSIRVEYVTQDNHSRLTKKAQWKKGGYNSYNFIVGHIAMGSIRDCKNVEFNIHPHLMSPISVCGYNYLTAHGHQIRGWAGIPYYGIDRLVGREAFARIRREYEIPGEFKFYKVVIGHFHTPMSTIKYNVNGSLSGTTELDRGQGRYSPPCQTAWLVHPKWGEFSWNSFWLGRN